LHFIHGTPFVLSILDRNSVAVKLISFRSSVCSDTVLLCSNAYKSEIKITPSLWSPLPCSLDHPDWFGLEFHSCFAQPAVLEISEKNKPKPRGRQKEIAHFVNDMKIRAGVLYAFFGYWSKRPVGEWPGYLKNLIKMAKNDEVIINIPIKKGKIKGLGNAFKEKFNFPFILARYCIKKVYGETINSFGLKLFDDPKNFLKTYVHADRRAKRFSKVFGSKSPQEVAIFAHTYPALKYIFETLQVI
jgi:hypothetical protein